MNKDVYIGLTPTFSTPAVCARIFHSCIFHPCNYARAAFSTPAFSVAPQIDGHTILRQHSPHFRPIYASRGKKTTRPEHNGAENDDASADLQVYLRSRVTLIYDILTSKLIVSCLCRVDQLWNWKLIKIGSFSKYWRISCLLFWTQYLLLARCGQKNCYSTLCEHICSSCVVLALFLKTLHF